jgi:Flp pilus assembly protein TadG
MVIQQPARDTRKGATLVECALVFPALIFLMLAIVVGAMGVFRYQQMAWLAREGARWASVRGTKYEMAGNNAITAADVYHQVIAPNATALDLDQLSYSVSWNPDRRPNSTVTVTVNYNWVPEVFLGAIPLSSSSTMPITY